MRQVRLRITIGSSANASGRWKITGDEGSRSENKNFEHTCALALCVPIENDPRGIIPESGLKDPYTPTHARGVPAFVMLEISLETVDQGVYGRNAVRNPSEIPPPPKKKSHTRYRWV